MKKTAKPVIPDPPDEDMIFSEDMFYDSQTVPIYDKGKPYRVAGNMVERWLLRGGMIVGDKTEQHVPLDPELAKEHLARIAAEKKAKEDADGQDAEKAKADADARRAEEAVKAAADAKAKEDAKAKADAEKKASPKSSNK